MTIMRLLVIALPLYFGWELAQAPAFIGLPRDWAAAIAVCALAAIGDVVIVVALLGVGALAFGAWHWFAPPAIGRYATIVLVGVVIQVVIEWVAVDRLGLWSYQPWHPRVPAVGTGVAVLLQPIALLPTTFWLLTRWERSH